MLVDISISSTLQYCPDCSSPVLQEDNFCQECGALLKVVGTKEAESQPEELIEETREAPGVVIHPEVELELPAAAVLPEVVAESESVMQAEAELAELDPPVEKQRVPVVLTCLNCDARHDLPMKFCGSCGSPMDEIGVYTTPRLAAIDLPQINPFAVNGVRLESPILQRSSNPDDFRGPLSYTPPSPFKPGRDIAILLMLVTVVGVSVWYVLMHERANAPFSVKEALVQARTSIANERLDDAVRIMDKVTILKGGELTKSEQEVLDQALFLRAAKTAEEKPEAAVSDWLRISKNYVHYGDVKKRLEKIAPNLVASEKTRAVPPPPSEPVAIPRSKPERRVVPLVEPEVKPDEPVVTTKSEKTKDGTLITKSRWTYTDDDVAKYDKLLADYFSVERMSTRREIKDGLGVPVEKSEPPSFKEWLDQGRPNF